MLSDGEVMVNGLDGDVSVGSYTISGNLVSITLFDSHQITNFYL